jgi:hypothetical protein
MAGLNLVVKNLAVDRSYAIRIIGMLEQSARELAVKTAALATTQDNNVAGMAAAIGVVPFRLSGLGLAGCQNASYIECSYALQLIPPRDSTSRLSYLLN